MQGHYQEQMKAAYLKKKENRVSVGNILYYLNQISVHMRNIFYNCTPGKFFSPGESVNRIKSFCFGYQEAQPHLILSNNSHVKPY